MPARSTEHRDKFTNRYLVRRILAERSQDGITYYLVEWDGFALEDCTWEPRSNFHDENSFIRWAEAQDEGDILPYTEIRRIQGLIDSRHEREAAERRKRKEKKKLNRARKTAPPVSLAEEPSPPTSPIKQEQTRPDRPLNPLLIPVGADIIVIDDDEDQIDERNDDNETGGKTPTNHDRNDKTNERTIDKRKDSVQVSDLPLLDVDVQMTDDPPPQDPTYISSDDDEPEENIAVAYNDQDDLESITLKLGPVPESSGSEFEPDDNNDASSDISPPSTQQKSAPKPKPKPKTKQQPKKTVTEAVVKKRGRLVQGVRRRVVDSDSDEE